METIWNDAPIEILLVEDNPGDIQLTREVFKEAKIPTHLHVVEDGQSAIDFLYHRQNYINAPRPDLILLDLNLPKKNGLEVLAEIRTDSLFRTIPIIILTTSQSEKDILKSYQLQANCFITKPFGLEEFIAVVQAIRDFWLTIVQLPSH